MRMHQMIVWNYSKIIDALLKVDQPMTVTRTRAKDPDDPWADVPLPPEPTR